MNESSIYLSFIYFFIFYFLTVQYLTQRVPRGNFQAALSQGPISLIWPSKLIKKLFNKYLFYYLPFCSHHTAFCSSSQYWLTHHFSTWQNPLPPRVTQPNSSPFTTMIAKIQTFAQLIDAYHVQAKSPPPFLTIFIK